MLNRDRFSGSKDSERLRVCALSRLARHVLHLRTDEARCLARVGGNGEGVRWKGMQRAAGVVEELESLITRVGQGGGDFQVLDTIDDLRSRDLQGEARRSIDRGCGSCEGDKSCTKSRREHVFVSRRWKLNSDGTRNATQVNEE